MATIMQTASYLVKNIIIFFTPAYCCFLRKTGYDAFDCYLLPIIQRLWYVKAYTRITDIDGNAPNNLISSIGIHIFNRVREVRTFVFPLIKLHIVILLFF
ncbi:MAG: hypothetical protein A2Y97_12015 [Nitrospirae bacterium RBG_13_39_12]|nr:MAG: hypothetical protein A2Y97_12015 [Nitrospirae bacterium RBG_13_39_12]